MVRPGIFIIVYIYPGRYYKIQTWDTKMAYRPYHRSSGKAKVTISGARMLVYI